MATTRYEDLEDAGFAADATRDDDGDEAASGLPAWLISGAAHLLVLAIFSLVVFITRTLDEDTAPLRLTRIDPPMIIDPPPKTPPPVVPSQNHDVFDPDAPVADDPSPVQILDQPVADIAMSEDEDATTDVPRGREEAKAMSEEGAEGLILTPIGVGGPPAGLVGSRTGGGPARAVRRWSGPVGVLSSVDAALRWFKRHQSPNGMWSVAGYPVNCAEAGKCEPGEEHLGEEGDIACTAYALLCFLGDGYDQRMPSRYKATVRKGMDWLIAQQKPDGLWGARNYEHAIATMAVAEAYAMSSDPALAALAQKAVDRIIARQCRDAAGGYGLGWDYQEPTTRNDSSVTGWNVMALKSAAAAGLAVGNAMDGAKEWLHRAWTAANPDAARIDPYGESRFPYTWDPASGSVGLGAVGADEHDLAPVGAVCAVFLDHREHDPVLETLCNYIAKHQQPAAYPCNTYYLYYDTLAIFQAAGRDKKEPRWQAWNDQVMPILIAAQRRGDGCFDGSWDAAGTRFPGHRTGRLLSTAYCCLSVEVYWRYQDALRPAK